jgi:methionine synthase I (cobalamin-dependent)
MPNWNFSEVIEPVRLETFYRDWLDKGVQLLGGCCGLTVDHIRAAAKVRDERR